MPLLTLPKNYSLGTLGRSFVFSYRLPDGMWETYAVGGVPVKYTTPSAAADSAAKHSTGDL